MILILYYESVSIIIIKWCYTGTRLGAEVLLIETQISRKNTFEVLFSSSPKEREPYQV